MVRHPILDKIQELELTQILKIAVLVNAERSQLQHFNSDFPCLPVNCGNISQQLGLTHQQLLELVQEGIIGLYKAVNKYDPDRGVRFGSYAAWWIKQSLSAAIQTKSRIIRVPGHIHELLGTMARYQRRFITRKLSMEELAEMLGLPVQKVYELRTLSPYVNSIEDKIFENSKTNSRGSTLKEKMVSKSLSPEQLINQQSCSLYHELYHSFQTKLSVKEVDIIEKRFGLLGSDQMTLKEVSGMYNLTIERIRQIEVRALHKLRSSEDIKFSTVM